MKALTPIILIIVSVLLFFFVIDPEYNKTKQLRSERAENDQLIELTKELEVKREDLKIKYENISDEEKELLAKFLPDNVDNIRLILDIDNIASAYGITLEGINVSADSSSNENQNDEKVVRSTGSTGQIGTISLSFNAKASYDVFKRFLNDLQKSLRLVDVKKITVSGGGGAFYNYSVKLDTYWLR